MQLQRVTSIIEPKAMRMLGVQQRHDVTPTRKPSGLLLRPGLSGQAPDQMDGNEIANLPKCVELAAGWGDLALFHTCRVAGQLKLFQPFFLLLVGRLWARHSVRAALGIKPANGPFDIYRFNRGEAISA